MFEINKKYFTFLSLIFLTSILLAGGTKIPPFNDFPDPSDTPTPTPSPTCPDDYVPLTDLNPDWHDRFVENYVSVKEAERFTAGCEAACAEQNAYSHKIEQIPSGGKVILKCCCS